MSEKEIQKKIIENSEKIARIIASDTDIELRRDRNKGIKVLKVEKKEI